jgi:hypothetical protein
MYPQQIYHVSDGKLPTKSFTNIDEAVDYADKTKGLVLIEDNSNNQGFNIVYSWGERDALRCTLTIK